MASNVASVLESHQLRYIPVAERKIQIPSDTPQDDLSFVMSPVKRILRRYRHWLSS